jgi:hypothetical protein
MKNHKHYWSDSSGRIELAFTDAYDSGYHSGDCEQDIRAIIDNDDVLILKYNDTNGRSYLHECGLDDVDNMSDDDILMYVVWMACGDIMGENA